MTYEQWAMQARNYVRFYRTNMKPTGFHTGEVMDWSMQHGLAASGQPEWWIKLLSSERMTYGPMGWADNPKQPACGGCARRGRWLARQLHRLANWLERR